MKDHRYSGRTTSLAKDRLKSLSRRASLFSLRRNPLTSQCKSTHWKQCWHGQGHGGVSRYKVERAVFSWAKFLAETPAKPKTASASLFEWAVSLEQEEELVGLPAE